MPGRHRTKTLVALTSSVTVALALLGGAPAANAQGLYVASTGNVGIGTNDPGTSRLLVKPGANDANITIESTSSTQYDQSLTFKDPGGSWVIGQRWQNTSNDLVLPAF